MAGRKGKSQAEYHSPAYHRPFVPLGPRPPVTEEGTRYAKEVIAFAKKLGQKRPDRSWAPKVLKRAAAGEPICYRAIELAREVIELDAQQREPGSDDDAR